MRKLAFSLLAASLFLAACSKDDQNFDESPVNNFTYNNETVNTPYGYLFDWNLDGRQIAFADKDLLQGEFSGIASAVGIDIDTVISGQTYTYKNSDSTGYDRTKNFDEAFVYFKQKFENGEFDEENGTHLDSLIGGSVTVKKSQEIYSIVYELKYKDITVKGEYNGELEIVK